MSEQDRTQTLNQHQKKKWQPRLTVAALLAKELHLNTPLRLQLMANCVRGNTSPYHQVAVFICHSKRERRRIQTTDIQTVKIIQCF